MERRAFHINGIENPLLKAFIALIEKGPISRRSLTFYAKELHVSASYLNAICKKHMSTSAAQLVRSYVTHEAKRMLLESELRIKEIAFSLGFSNLPTFTKYFKKETGLSPKTFKSLRKDIANPAI
jgi:AraC-type DNA-binding domain-containing proteins